MPQSDIESSPDHRPIYGNQCSQEKTNRGILALFLPNPQARRKERSHEPLGKSRKKAESREPMTLCHENEEVHTSDSDAA